MKRIVVYANCCKESAERLAHLLKCPSSLAAEDEYFGYDEVINYGSSLPLRSKKIINKPKEVAICTNKISTLKRLSDRCSTIEWTKSKEKALTWLQEDGVVIARQLEASNQGKGLVTIQTQEEFAATNAKFYTRYFWHTNEVRVNVFKDEIISVYDKVIEGDEFIFYPLTINGESPQVREMIEAIQENIGISYYGMDVLFNGIEYKLLEVNSGPILHPQTEKGLVKAIKGAM